MAVLNRGLDALELLHAVVETLDAQRSVLNQMHDLEKIIGSVEAMLLDESDSDG